MAIQVQSFLNSATKLSTTATTATTVAQLKTLVNAIEGVSTSIMEFYIKNDATTATVLVSGTLGSYGITTSTTIYSSNTISTATSKVDRQLAKLELAQLRRQAGGNTTTNYYRTYNVYDEDLLADKYTSNTTTVGTTSTLVIGRPWITIPGSLLFSGSNYLTVDGNASTAMGLENLTWECFVYPTSSSDYQTFIDTRTNPVGGDTSGFYFGTDNNTLTPIFYTNELRLASSIDITLNAWNHVALTRFNGTATLWVNGVSGGTVSDTTSLSQQRVYIGGSTILPFTGYISNLRMLKGSAEYTATFTPPSGPLPVITNTVLLLNSSFNTNFLKDSSINNFTITNTGGVISDALNPFIAV